MILDKFSHTALSINSIDKLLQNKMVFISFSNFTTPFRLSHCLINANLILCLQLIVFVISAFVCISLLVYSNVQTFPSFNVCIRSVNNWFFLSCCTFILYFCYWRYIFGYKPRDVLLICPHIKQSHNLSVYVSEDRLKKPSRSLIISSMLMITETHNGDPLTHKYIYMYK